MAGKMIELEATYLYEKLRFENANGDVIIGDASTEGENGRPRRFVVKGTVDGDDPAIDNTYRFYGHWTLYQNRRSGRVEKQFAFKTFVRCEPHSRAGIVRYLTHAPNIGRVLATRLWDKFHSDAVRILREDPEVAASATDKLSVDGAKEAATWLGHNRALEGCTIDLMDLLDGFGFPKTTAKMAVKIYGNRASEIIKRNPYVLMRFRGCGFKLADALYLNLGGDPAKLKRQTLCGWYSISTASSGNTWHYVGFAEQGIKGSVSGAEADCAKAIRLGVRAKIMETIWNDGRDGPQDFDGTVQWIAEASKAESERRVARYLNKASTEGPWPVSVDNLVNVSDHQRDNLAKAIGLQAIGLLGGSPGTGKTYAAAALIAELINQFGALSIAVCAPTGKAAVRIGETLSEYNLPIRAKTIHSLLGVEQADDGDGWSFKHGRSNPLPYRFIILDECSMADTTLMASFLSARAKGTYILFVGDVNQLPPVGHGAPLRDMIGGGLPYGELREIHRNAGQIVKACAAIRDGKPFEIGGNLQAVFGPSNTVESQIQCVIDLLDEFVLSDDDPIWDCQVVVAVNKKSGVSRAAVNEALQQHLNPNPKIQGTPFRLIDKVVCLKNGFYPNVNEETDEDVTTNARGDLYVANGEIGQIIQIEKKYMECTLWNPDRRVRVPFGPTNDGDTGCNWDLAYGLTVHKMQGSEASIVIVIVDECLGAKRICDRAWLYTAISRAKKVCVLVGKVDTAQRFCRVNNIAKRKTFLKELIENAKPNQV